MWRIRFISLLMAVTLILALSLSGTKATAAGKADLTIAMKSSFDDMEFMKLVNRYESETGKNVEVTFYSGDEELNAKMNTELLSGAGPDLIQGTEIPYWTFAERGVFIDFNELIENDPDVNMDEYYANIIDPLRDAEGHLYIMPCSFRFFYVMINEQLFEKAGLSVPKEWTLQSLLKSCVEFTDAKETPPNTYAMSWGNELLSKATEDELMASIAFSKGESYFKQIDDVILEYLAEPSIISSSMDFANPMTALYDISNYLYFSQTLSLSTSLLAPTMIIFQNDQYEVRNFPRSEYEEGEYLYEPQLAFCINKAGKTDEAWQFVKFLLSDDVQTGSMDPLSLYAIENPVNAEAAQQRMDLIRKQAVEQTENVKNGVPAAGKIRQSKHSPDDYMNQMNRYIDIYTELRDNLHTPVLSDAVLKESLLSAIRQESGDKFSASKARKEISRITDVYMGEEGGDLQSGYTIIWSIVALVIVIIVAVILAKAVKRKSLKRKDSMKTNFK